MRVVLPVAKGPGSLEAAISSFVRVFEEFPADSLSVIYYGAENEAKNIANVFSEKFKLDCEQVKLKHVVEPGLAKEIYDRVLAPHSSSGILSIISSASRRVASSLSLATFMLKNVLKQNEVPIDVVHIHFYWGEWSGLFYPYTPRSIEPIISMLSDGRFFSENLRKTAHLFTNLESEGLEMLVNPETPLRRCIAEFTRRVNQLDKAPYRMPTRESKIRTIFSAEIRYKDREIRLEFNLYDPIEVVSNLSRLSKTFRNEQYFKEVLIWSGISSLKAMTKDLKIVDLRHMNNTDPIIIDTNLLYYGIHNLAYSGGRIIIPECVILEVENRVSEAIKGGKICGFKELLDCLAYLSLKELLSMRSSIYPSSWPCDTSIPKIDPVLLADKAIVTGDDGAYRRWSKSPIARIATLYKASYDLLEIVSTTEIARIYYSTFQLLSALAIANNQGLIDYLEIRVNGERINFPLSPIIKELGI